MAYYRVANREDALWLGPRLRDEDQEEARAALGITGTESLLLGLHASTECNTMVGDDEVPIGMFGVTPTSDPDVAFPWMLATAGLSDNKSHTIQFLRQCRVWVDKTNLRYPVLTNLVDARNGLHMRWLKWCGFIFVRRVEKYGLLNLPFYEFVRIQCA